MIYEIPEKLTYHKNEKVKKLDYVGVHKPPGPCQQFSTQTICDQNKINLGCTWIPSQYTCRSPKNSIPKASIGHTLAYVPTPSSSKEYNKPLNFSSCTYNNNKEKCNLDDDCIWIEQKNGSQYCRNRHGHHVNNNSNYNYINIGKYSQEEKDSWYDHKLLNEVERKYCRCVLEIPTRDLFNGGGQQKYNPYSVCLSRVGNSSNNLNIYNKDNINTNVNSTAALRSALSKVSRSGKCSIDAKWENIPTEILYAYATNKSLTNRGKQYFSNRPTIEEIIKHPNKYRPLLLQDINNYMNKK